jgi:sugar phosphate isomerase/epimerase
MSTTREVGIAHLTLLHVPPAELVTIARDAGFDSVGVRVGVAGPGEEPWPMTPGSPMLDQTVRRLEDTGMRVLDIEVLQLRPDTRREDYEPMLEAGGRLGARYVNVLAEDRDLDRVSERFAEVTADARGYGLRALIEPMAYRPVSDLRRAVRIAERSGGGGVEVDSLHFQRYGGDFDELRAVDPALLPMMQLCDAPLAAPTGLPRPERLPRGQAVDVDDPLLESRAFRLLPGDGELPLAELVDAMPPGIPISVEAPVLPLQQALTPLEVARRARESVATFVPRGAAA